MIKEYHVGKIGHVVIDVEALLNKYEAFGININELTGEIRVLTKGGWQVVVAAQAKEEPVKYRTATEAGNAILGNVQSQIAAAERQILGTGTLSDPFRYREATTNVPNPHGPNPAGVLLAG